MGAILNLCMYTHVKAVFIPVHTTVHFGTPGSRASGGKGRPLGEGTGVLPFWG